jgi:UDPglucose--hexose-1-phosphate uridylyltransferase
MSEIRQDKLTEQWVIFAPERAQRPHSPVPQAGGKASPAEFDANCPFCVGNETMLPPILLEKEAKTPSTPSKPSKPEHNWQTRVVPNKYPVLTAEAETAGGNRGIYLVAAGYGRHEVIIESPLHSCDIPTMSVHEVETVIETYLDRYNTIYAQHRDILTVILFRNHGQMAGTSLVHPHSQLVAMGIVPGRIANRQNVAERYFSQENRCLMCDIIAFEQGHAQRLIFENNSFIAFVPFAAAVPFEVLIVPKEHSSDFGSLSPEHVSDLALALRSVLSGLRQKADDPDYNYIFQTYSRHDTPSPSLHWYIQIRPRLGIPAGFEIGSGISVNHSLPEQDAQRLREAIEQSKNNEVKQRTEAPD